MGMTNKFDDDAPSLARLCDTGLSLDPQRVALIQGERSMTYAELEQRINRVANGLISLGVERSERVLVIFENDIRFPEVLLGIVRAGAVAVPVNFKFPPPQHIDLARDCGSSHCLRQCRDGRIRPRLPGRRGCRGRYRRRCRPGSASKL